MARIRSWVMPMAGGDVGTWDPPAKPVDVMGLPSPEGHIAKLSMPGDPVSLHPVLSPGEILTRSLRGRVQGCSLWCGEMEAAWFPSLGDRGVRCEGCTP